MALDPNLNVPYNGAQFQATVQSIGSSRQTLAQQANQYVQAARAAAGQGKLDGGDMTTLQRLWTEITTLVKAIDDAISADRVPPALYELKFSWLAIENRLSLVPNGIKPEQLGIDLHWKSKGARDNVQAYKNVVKLQGDAVARCLSIVHTTGDRIARMAGYGFGFYVNLYTLLAKFMPVLGKSLFALLQPEVAPGVIKEGLNSLYNSAIEAVKEYNVLINSADIWVNPEMDSDLNDQTGFGPTGHWPASRL